MKQIVRIPMDQFKNPIVYIEPFDDYIQITIEDFGERLDILKGKIQENLRKARYG